jgi:hypothetical protein
VGGRRPAGLGGQQVGSIGYVEEDQEEEGAHAPLEGEPR